MALIGTHNNVTSTNQAIGISYKSMTNSSVTDYNIVSISIPEAGIWHINAEYRMGWCSFGRFCRGNLQCAAGGQHGTPWRMILENLSQRACNGNIALTNNWYITVKTGNSFSLSVELHIVNYDTTGSTLFQTTDSNGIPMMSARKVGTTTTGGSGIAIYGA